MVSRWVQVRGNGRSHHDCQRTHHASEGEQRRLDLRHVAVLKQVVGFKVVVRLQAKVRGGFDEVSQILQLQTHRFKQNQPHGAAL